MDSESIQPQEFCLKWNNYNSNVISSIGDSIKEENFTDVAISSQGKKYWKAHKFLLSACSDYFKDVLKILNQLPQIHSFPVIMLPNNIEPADVDKLMTYMYHGEVNVKQEDLERFLEAACTLKIKGLAEGNEKKISNTTKSSKKKQEFDLDDEGGSSPKRSRLSSENNSFAVITESANSPDDVRQNFDAEIDLSMVPVKQELIEFKDVDFDSTDADSFINETLLREGASTSVGNAQTSVPPPPGPLVPSYVPPPQAKSADGNSRIRRKNANEVYLLKSTDIQILPTPKRPEIPRPKQIFMSKSLSVSPVSPEVEQSLKSLSAKICGEQRHSLSPGQGIIQTPSLPLVTSHSGSMSSPTTPLSSSLWRPKAQSSPYINSMQSSVASTSSESDTSSSSNLSCLECKRGFTTKSNLNKHKRVMHSLERHPCKFCGRSFKNLYYIKDHMSICSSNPANAGSALHNSTTAPQKTNSMLSKKKGKCIKHDDYRGQVSNKEHTIANVSSKEDAVANIDSKPNLIHNDSVVNLSVDKRLQSVQHDHNDRNLKLRHLSSSRQIDKVSGENSTSSSNHYYENNYISQFSELLTDSDQTCSKNESTNQNCETESVNVLPFKM